ncbi:OmpH family outer membrane protein [Alphaproteobacteria bacterium]|nr:OmpH family outer membrane protein [Alphaproteobacteria bacterium]
MSKIMLLKFLLLPILAEASFDLNYMKSKKIEFIKNSKISLISQNDVFENIGIVDFRFILKKSEAMKKIGDEFLLLEKKLNINMKDKQKYLKNKELVIKKEKLNLTNQEYKSKLDSFKKEVFSIQKKIKEDRAILNNSFQKIQNDLKNLLAKVIKDLSIKRKIHIVILKENVFLFNKKSLDITDEALQIFNEKTKSLKIIISSVN